MPPKLFYMIYFYYDKTFKRASTQHLRKYLEIKIVTLLLGVCCVGGGEVLIADNETMPSLLKEGEGGGYVKALRPLSLSSSLLTL